MTAQRYLNNANSAQQTSMERLASGFSVGFFKLTKASMTSKRRATALVTFTAFGLPFKNAPVGETADDTAILEDEGTDCLGDSAIISLRLGIGRWLDVENVLLHL